MWTSPFGWPRFSLRRDAVVRFDGAGSEFKRSPVMPGADCL